MDADRDGEAFTRLLELVGEITDVSVSAARTTMYFGALKQYDYAIVQAAINQHIATSKYFPKPADLRDIIEGTEAEQDSNRWLALDEAIRKVGVWQSVIVADPVMAEAIIRVWGSWIALCVFRNENDEFLWNSKRKDFVAAYRIASKYPRRNADPVLLAGHCERQNHQSGRYQARGYYGAILVDGRTETRYLDIDNETGLPALPLRECIALPPASTRLALQPMPDGETGIELDADAARKALQEGLDRLLKAHTFPDRIIVKDDPDAERRAVLREQARLINAEGKQSPVTSTNDVRASQDVDAGEPDRTSDPSGGVADTGTGVRIRKRDRSEVGSRLRVDGVSDPAGNRRRSVRERDQLRAGQLDNEDGSQRTRRKGKNSGHTPTVGKGKTRRKT